MRMITSNFRRFGAGLFVFMTVWTTTSFAQPAVLFEDDFDRGWRNAMTHTALPAWSGGGLNFIPGLSVPFNVEVQVTGTTYAVRVDGALINTSSDPDLAPGTVGVFSWGQRSGGNGSEFDDLRLVDAAGTTIFSESWDAAVADWQVVTQTAADGEAYAGANNFRYDPANRLFIEDSNGFRPATAGFDNIDFIGPAIRYNGPGAADMTNYEMRVRIRTADNDGVCLLVRVLDDNNFYRISFGEQDTTPPSNRPIDGVSVQKCRNGTWSSLFMDEEIFRYFPHEFWDVSVQIQDNGAGGANLDVTIIDDPDGQFGGPFTITVPTITDAADPVPSGPPGFQTWGVDIISGGDVGAAGDQRGAQFSRFGATDTPLVRALPGGETLLEGFPTYNDWDTSYPIPEDFGTQTERAAPGWGIRVSDGVLMENSDSIQFGAVNNENGQWRPDIYFKGGGLVTPEDYTFSATLTTIDNDGLGLVFGYQDEDNYFRAAFRQENNPNNAWGYPTGLTIQKVVGGTITPLVTLLPPRDSIAGIWMQKPQSGAIEQSVAEALSNSSGQQDGVEFQGPRLVRGDTSWTDYTLEAIIESGTSPAGAPDDVGALGLLMRFQDELNYYRLTFRDGPMPDVGDPPFGISVQRVRNGVYTEIFRDGDEVCFGDNDVGPQFDCDGDGVPDPPGFAYDHRGVAGVGFRIWRTRLIGTGADFRLEIDAIADVDLDIDGDGNLDFTEGEEFPNYYVATFSDPLPNPLLSGMVGLHTHGQNSNEFREIGVTLAGSSTPEFEDGIGLPDPKGWEDATLPTFGQTGFNGVAAEGGTGTEYSGMGIRIDLQKAGPRDNRWITGSIPSQFDTNPNSTIDWDGPRMVAGDVSWTDYRYCSDLISMDDDGIGLLFRYQDENNFYRLSFCTNRGGHAAGHPPEGVSVTKKQNGIYSELFYDSSFQFVLGETWTACVTMIGENFQIDLTQLNGDVDGDGTDTYHFELTDNTDPILSGRIGLTVWGEMAEADEVNSLLGGVGLDWTMNFNEGAAFDNVLVTEVPPPALVAIADALGGTNPATSRADTFISPLGENVPLSAFALEATEPLVLNEVVATYTGSGPAPSAELVDEGDGMHMVLLDPPPEPGQWLKLTFRVTGQATGRPAEFDVWVAHQPLDINQDGESNIRDATAFGEEFRSRMEPRLIDINGDGIVDVRDATAFGANWNGQSPATMPWRNTGTTPKP